MITIVCAVLGVLLVLISIGSLVAQVFGVQMDEEQNNASFFCIVIGVVLIVISVVMAGSK